ncbi:MAG TPA: GAF domain-containing protein [Steroidobacteraceae bacterium]|nr:GAF domain-containing protein [Steroidobacteraceae bacterium]
MIQPIQPSDLLVDTLQGRRWVHDLHAEIAAFDELAHVTAAEPDRSMQPLIDAVLGLYGAGSAGLSVLRPGSSGHTDFVWEAVSGALAAHQGDGTPRDFSPCGLCLDIGTAVVLARPERVFTYLARVQPTIFEALIVPLYDDDHTPLGALWVVHHDPVARFGVDDVSTIERLAASLAVALERARQPDESPTVAPAEQAADRRATRPASDPERGT